MPRKPSVWFREQDGYYYTTIRGDQKKLSKDEEAAEREFHRLLSQPPDATPSGDCRTWGQVAAVYEQHLLDTEANDTAEQAKRFLGSFGQAVGIGKPIVDLRRYMLTNWLNGHKTWSQSTRALACGLVLAALNYCEEEGRTGVHPLHGYKRPAFTSRTDYLDPATRRKVLASIKDPSFKRFVSFLAWTGARPFSEVAKLTAANFDPLLKRFRLDQHKNKKKSGKPRFIYLSPEVLDMVKGLCQLHPKGPIFVKGSNGNPWTPDGVWKRLKAIKTKLGLPVLRAYTFRHTYITDALLAGRSVSLVAELVGNSPQTIHNHYSHIVDAGDRLATEASIIATAAGHWRS